MWLWPSRVTSWACFLSRARAQKQHLLEWHTVRLPWDIQLKDMLPGIVTNTTGADVCQDQQDFSPGWQDIQESERWQSLHLQGICFSVWQQCTDRTLQFVKCSHKHHLHDNLGTDVHSSGHWGSGILSGLTGTTKLLVIGRARSFFHRPTLPDRMLLVKKSQEQNERYHK